MTSDRDNFLKLIRILADQRLTGKGLVYLREQDLAQSSLVSQVVKIGVPAHVLWEFFVGLHNAPQASNGDFFQGARKQEDTAKPAKGILKDAVQTIYSYTETHRPNLVASNHPPPLTDAGAIDELIVVERWNAAVSELKVDEVSEYRVPVARDVISGPNFPVSVALRDCGWDCEPG